jgi:hypothetical protein
MFDPIDEIERENQIRLLGVVMLDNFSVVLSADCSQRIFLSKDFGIRVYPSDTCVYDQLGTRYISTVVRFIPACSCYLFAKLIGRKDALL